MLPAKSLGDQNIDGMVEKVLSAMPEQFFCLRVHEHHPASLIHDNHGVRCSFEQPPEFLLGFLALGDVARNLCKATQMAVLVVQRGNDHVGPKQRPALYSPAVLFNRPSSAAIFNSRAGLSCAKSSAV